MGGQDGQLLAALLQSACSSNATVQLKAASAGFRVQVRICGERPASGAMGVWARHHQAVDAQDKGLSGVCTRIISARNCGAAEVLVVGP